MERRKLSSRPSLTGKQSCLFVKMPLFRSIRMWRRGSGLENKAMNEGQRHAEEEAERQTDKYGVDEQACIPRTPYMNLFPVPHLPCFPLSFSAASSCASKHRRHALLFALSHLVNCCPCNQRAFRLNKKTENRLMPLSFIFRFFCKIYECIQRDAIQMRTHIQMQSDTSNGRKTHRHLHRWCT